LNLVSSFMFLADQNGGAPENDVSTVGCQVAYSRLWHAHRQNRKGAERNCVRRTYARCHVPHAGGGQTPDKYRDAAGG
jgi:hypothetical protein